jgi:hypothetical protein
MGVIGYVAPPGKDQHLADLRCSDISEAFPNGEYSQYYRNDWLTNMARDTRANKEFSPRTQDTARWAREQIKRQIGKTQPPRLDASQPPLSRYPEQVFGNLDGPIQVVIPI